jgi:hypothetical protein
MFRRKHLLDLLLDVNQNIVQTRGFKQKAKLNIILKEVLHVLHFVCPMQKSQTLQAGRC